MRHAFMPSMLHDPNIKNKQTAKARIKMELSQCKIHEKEKNILCTGCTRQSAPQKKKDMNQHKARVMRWVQTRGWHHNVRNQPRRGQFQYLNYNLREIITFLHRSEILQRPFLRAFAVHCRLMSVAWLQVVADARPFTNASLCIVKTFAQLQHNKKKRRIKSSAMIFLCAFSFILIFQTQLLNIINGHKLWQWWQYV